MTSRKVKAVAAVILLLITLLCISVFYTKEAVLPGKVASRRDDSAATVRAEAPKKVETYSAPEKSDAQKKIAKMTERTDFLGNSAAILMTEDVQRGMVNKAVTRLEQAYQPLFSKWGVTEANRMAVHDIIRAREARLISIRVAAQKEGIDAMLKSKKVIESERAGYALELSELLGAEKMRELALLDKTVLEKAIATLRAGVKK